MRKGYPLAAVRPFTLLGRDHLIAIAAIAVATALLIRFARRHPRAHDGLRRVLAGVLLGLMTVGLILLRQQGVPWSSLAPLQLCDVAIFVAAFALLSLNPLACEIAYFWGASGTVLAVLTPDLGVGFPAPEYFTYFALHGAVIATALLLPFGLARPPRPGAVWRALLVTDLYALAVGVVDIAWGTNFLYLRAKPPHPTPLDWFGPWPVYLLVGEVVALALFTALSIPFRRRGR